MARSIVFTSKRGQTVRLPKAVAFPQGVCEVDVIKVGHSRVITPVGRRWDDFFLTGPHVGEDFLADRGDLPAEQREPF